MESLGYNVSEYNMFSINEIDSMYNHDQLDMLLSNEKTGKKVYIKYYCTGTKQLRPATLDTFISDLYEIEEVLNTNDTLVIIINEEPNETMIQKLIYIYEKYGVFVVIHNIKRLQFNILNHILVPKATILNEEEVEKLRKDLNITDILTQLPEISRFDPQALAIALRPKEVVKFIRNSQTALETNYYRVCVNK
jgi:DNA-directed RNA polymerase subunit H (RpoH/RPB5)